MRHGTSSLGSRTRTPQAQAAERWDLWTGVACTFQLDPLHTQAGGVVLSPEGSCLLAREATPSGLYHPACWCCSIVHTFVPTRFSPRHRRLSPKGHARSHPSSLSHSPTAIYNSPDPPTFTNLPHSPTLSLYRSIPSSPPSLTLILILTSPFRPSTRSEYSLQARIPAALANAELAVVCWHALVGRRCLRRHLQMVDPAVQRLTPTTARTRHTGQGTWPLHSRIPSPSPTNWP